MKILYAIQGTGNGHVSRAREIIPHLKNYGELDLLVSGTQAEVGLDDAINFKLHGLGFVFGEDGGVDFAKTWKQFHTKQFINDIRNLPVKDYDIIINDFEPVSAWACRLRGKPSISLSHQSAYVSGKTPQLKGFHWGKTIMNHYAPTNAHIGFHFERYDDFIHTPVIRSEVRNLESENLGHYTVYLPAYSDQFILSQIENYRYIKWEIFSKHSKNYYTSNHVEIFPIENKRFLSSLATCKGFLTGGGFEGPAEALFLKKKVLAVPMKNQYEQQCNALAMQNMGIPIIWHEHEFEKKLKEWIHEDLIIEVNYPDETEQIIKNLFYKYSKEF